MTMIDHVKNMCVQLYARGIVVVVLGEEDTDIQVGSYGFTVKGENITYALDDLIHREVFDPGTGRLDAAAMRKFADQLDRDSLDLEECSAPMTVALGLPGWYSTGHDPALDDTKTSRPRVGPTKLGLN